MSSLNITRTSSKVVALTFDDGPTPGFTDSILTVLDRSDVKATFFVTGRGVDDVIDLVALREKEHARFETLSGGQRQRLAVACALVADLGDHDRAVDVMGPYFERTLSTAQIKHADVDPDLDPIRDDARFKSMMADAKQRLGMVEAVAK